MPVSSAKVQAEHRRKVRDAPFSARVHHADMHSPHLALIGVAQTEDEHNMAKGMLAKATPGLIAALDLLLELHGEELPESLREAIRKHLDESTVAGARKWASTTGYGLVHKVAREHLRSQYFGGSWKGFKRFLNGAKKVFEAPFKLIGKALEGGSKVVGNVAENLRPAISQAAEIAQKAGPAVAML